MKVFISWSGERSKAVAHALRDWLPLVLHYTDPWASELDIDAGERWAQSVAGELEASNFGIVCLTAENLASPWILFESGALAKSLQMSRVVPVLLDIEFSDVTGPLAQFQAKKLVKQGIKDLIASIQTAAPDEAVPTDRVDKLFDGLWAQLQDRVDEIPGKAPPERQTRPQVEVLEELVLSIRTLDVRVRESESLIASLPGRSDRSRGRRTKDVGLLRDLAHFVADGSEDNPVYCMILASTFREDYPWFYDQCALLLASRSGAKQREWHGFLRTADFLANGPLLRDDEYLREIARELLFSMEREAGKRQVLERPV